MTLHKAKGLEFDCVFIPRLDATTRGEERPLLLWDEYTTSGGERGFLLAADDHSGRDCPGLYNFLRARRRHKSKMETTRLLYVGATRAVQRPVAPAAGCSLRITRVHAASGP
jgi:ATP-dependent helicase/nuclease subunit A